MSEPYVISALVITVAFFGESMFGFGGGLIAVPILSLVLGVREAVTLILIFQFLMGTLIWKTYKKIQWPVVLPMTGGLVIGTIAGTFALSAFSPDLLRLVLALTIIIFLIRSWFLSETVVARETNNLIGNISGLAGGLFTGLIGAGGPPIIMYLSGVIKNKTAMRASLIYLFFITNVVRITISIPQSLFTSQVLKIAAIVLPFFLIAIVLGQVVHHRINEDTYRQAVNVLLLVSVILLLAKVF